MISATVAIIITYITTIIGLVWALINFLQIKSIDLYGKNPQGGITLLDDTERNKIQTMLSIGEYISRGANAFLYQQYKILVIFCLIFAVVIKLTVDGLNAQVATAIAFLLGSITSIASGFIGMRIAVYSNYRTAFKAQTSLSEAFRVAFRAGCVMGFALASLSLFVLITLVLIYRRTFNIVPDYSLDHRDKDNIIGHVYEAIAGYGLGGSAIALFGRVGGGIYTKAADVGADLVGKLEQDLPEDSPKNPATIADNVGDNVGDIAGMGADLFGSFAESTCAGLVILAGAQYQRFYTSQFQCGPQGPVVTWCESADTYLFYPLVLSGISIIACLLCSLFATHIMQVTQTEQIERTLRYQLLISTVLLTGALYLSAILSVSVDSNAVQSPNYAPGVNTLILPYEKTGSVTTGTQQFYNLTPTKGFLCSFSGLIVGLLIGLLTEYYTSNAFRPVQEVAESCKTGAATNIIYGLALGYLSNIFPVILLGIAAYISHRLLGLFGIALAALGMLSNLAIGLAIDAYGPISDNAGGIAEMSELGEATRHRTDALDSAGNTTAAIGKGFAIGSAAFVSLALYGAFITRATSCPVDAQGNQQAGYIITQVQVTDALLFSGLLIGAMLPYAFSAMTMKSVGKAALEMVVEIRRQLAENPKIKTGEVNPDYERCIAISTAASLREMIAPGCLVLFTPLAVGILFGPRALAGLLPGALVSGVQMAISSSNTGGAWDNAKKYIEAGKLIHDGVIKKKGSEEHKAAVIGDTVGDPLKDTSGPSLNILIKLSAILSLVFVPFVQKTGFLVGLLDEHDGVCKRA